MPVPRDDDRPRIPGTQHELVIVRVSRDRDRGGQIGHEFPMSDDGSEDRLELELGAGFTKALACPNVLVEDQRGDQKIYIRPE